jgi:hypothetical protein
MHHAYYTNHMKPWIQIKTHNRHNQHARAERGPPQVVGEQAGTNHSQVPHPGLYAVRMNNPKFQEMVIAFSTSCLNKTQGKGVTFPLQG